MTDEHRIRKQREQLEALSKRFEHLKLKRQWRLLQEARISRARQLTNYDEDHNNDR